MAAPSLDEIDPNRFYTAAEVAVLLFGRSAAWFYGRTRRELMKSDGFPRPLSSVGHPRWLGSDLLDWAMRPKASDQSVPLDEAQEDQSPAEDLHALLRDRARIVVGSGRRRRSS